MLHFDKDINSNCVCINIVGLTSKCMHIDSKFVHSKGTKFDIHRYVYSFQIMTNFVTQI